MMIEITPIVTLMHYDFPQVFIGKDVVDQLYVCMITSDDPITYLCTPISNMRATLLQTSKIDLKTVFDTPEAARFYECKITEDGALALCRANFEQCPDDLLPGDELYFESCDEVAIKAGELRSTVAYASLSALEAKDEPRIKTAKLAEFLTLYQNSIRHLTKRIKSITKSSNSNEDSHSVDVFGFSYGSFTIQMRSSHQESLFGDSPLLDQAFESLNQLFRLTNTPDEAIKYLQTFKGHTASSLVKILEFIVENACPISHQWANPNMEKASYADTNLQHVSELVKQCKTKEDLFTETVSLTGFFTAANSNTNTWRILDSKGKSRSGEIHPESKITMDGIIITKQKYKLLCEEKVELVSGTSKEVKKLLLISLEKIT